MSNCWAHAWYLFEFSEKSTNNKRFCANERYVNLE
ncbi:hypothetical protein T01_6920 [Trichinella spiralis]|uniref:Uncharacterized protein n=1 Tax=Trichinella spiralis TaxID=6334 RepID=A0A0V1ALP5_TRISP|nr:hypothetical protein T01_7807 [Trichinella spiralis]KRY25805.1 hypothetical protein T01_6920 [Trichinella spiralis]